MADEQVEPQVEEQFDPDVWLSELLADSEPEIEEVEREADEAVEDDKMRRITARLEKQAQELEGLKAAQKKDRMKEMVKDFTGALAADDVRREFLWVLEGADTGEKIKKAINTIEKLGKKALAAKVAEDTDAEDVERAFAAPVRADESVQKPGIEDQLFDRSKRGDTKSTLDLLLNHPRGL